MSDRSALDPAVYELKARLCRALGDGTRLRIVDALADRPLSVGALCTMLDAPQSTVSRHLKVLRDQSLVTGRHDGASVWYSLADERILEILDLMRGLLRTLLDEKTRLAGSLSAGEKAAAPP
jgi:DNA-binding transcriptional ArsR family regulator